MGKKDEPEAEEVTLTASVTKGDIELISPEDAPIHDRKKDKKMKKKKKKKKLKLPKPDIKDALRIDTGDNNQCTMILMCILVLILGLGSGWFFGKLYAQNPVGDPVVLTSQSPTPAPIKRRPSVIEFTGDDTGTTRGPTYPDEIEGGSEFQGTTRGPTYPPDLETNVDIDYDDVLHKIHTRLQEMCDYFPFNHDCFLLKRSVSPIPPIRDDGMNLMTKMLVRKILNNEKIVKFVGTGTSHTAAHDGLFGYNYVWVINRMIKKTFELANLNFTAYARGVGSQGPWPRQIYNPDSIYGDDADIVSNDGFFGQMHECKQEYAMQRNLHLKNQPIYVQVDLCGPCGLNNHWDSVYFSKKAWELDDSWDLTKDVMDMLVPTIADSKLTPGEGLEKAFHAEVFMDDEFMRSQFQILSEKDPKFEKWTKKETWDDMYAYWDRYIAVKGWVKDEDTPRTEKPLDEITKKYGGLYFDSGKVAKAVDWHAKYISRAYYTRAGTHHPGAFSHFYHGNQLGYYILENLRTAVEMIRDAGEVGRLKEIASERLDIPEPLNPKCVMPGEMAISSWIAVKPREPGHELESIITQGDYQLKQWIGTNHNAIDKHNEVSFESKDENDFLVINVKMGEELTRNHDTGEAWLCIFDKVFDPEESKVWVDGELVDFSDMDDKDYNEFFGYNDNGKIGNKANSFEFIDRRPMQVGGKLWLIKPVHKGDHEIKFHGKLLMRALWFM